MLVMPYTATMSDGDGFYVNGPSSGGECSFYGGTMYPESRLPTREAAEIIAARMNMAYRQGYKAAKLDMRKTLGFD